MVFALFRRLIEQLFKLSKQCKLSKLNELDKPDELLDETGIVTVTVRRILY